MGAQIDRNHQQLHEKILIEQSFHLNQCGRQISKLLKKVLLKTAFDDAEFVREETLCILRAIPKERFLHEIERLHSNTVRMSSTTLRGLYVSKLS